MSAGNVLSIILILYALALLVAAPIWLEYLDRERAKARARQLAQENHELR